MECDTPFVCLLPAAARHPGVEEDLLQGWPLRRLLAQTPANQMLALCDRNTRRWIRTFLFQTSHFHTFGL